MENNLLFKFDNEPDEGSSIKTENSEQEKGFYDKVLEERKKTEMAGEKKWNMTIAKLSLHETAKAENISKPEETPDQPYSFDEVLEASTE